MTHPSQLEAVRQLMADGEWRASHEIQSALVAQGLPLRSESALTARVRQLRTLGLVVECRCVRRGRYEYRLLTPVVQRELFA